MDQQDWSTDRWVDSRLDGWNVGRAEVPAARGAAHASAPGRPPTALAAAARAAPRLACTSAPSRTAACECQRTRAAATGQN
eukprot:scaffold3418_cov213-Prasinococcus_capsulatus_cf.AAC.1